VNHLSISLRQPIGAVTVAASEVAVSTFCSIEKSRWTFNTQDSNFYKVESLLFLNVEGPPLKIVCFLKTDSE